jgi:hypothetical protein
VVQVEAKNLSFIQQICEIQPAADGTALPVPRMVCVKEPNRRLLLVDGQNCLKRTAIFEEIEAERHPTCTAEQVDDQMPSGRRSQISDEINR